MINKKLDSIAKKSAKILDRVLGMFGGIFLGGTVALGVEVNTTADFDSLIIRDLTPR